MRFSKIVAVVSCVVGSWLLAPFAHAYDPEWSWTVEGKSGGPFPTKTEAVSYMQSLSGGCAEPAFCAMCGCSNHLAPSACLPVQVSQISERLLDS